MKTAAGLDVAAAGRKRCAEGVGQRSSGKALKLRRRRRRKRKRGHVTLPEKADRDAGEGDPTGSGNSKGRQSLRKSRESRGE